MYWLTVGTCRIPASYRLLLAEAMRRKAWETLFSQQAARLDEHMDRVRSKEALRREAFLKQVLGLPLQPAIILIE